MLRTLDYTKIIQKIHSPNTHLKTKHFYYILRLGKNPTEKNLLFINIILHSLQTNTSVVTLKFMKQINCKDNFTKFSFNIYFIIFDLLVLHLGTIN
jgi:hypothetical protein